MLDAYLEIFYATSISLTTLIVPVIAIYILINLVASLLFQK